MKDDKWRPGSITHHTIPYSTTRDGGVAFARRQLLLLAAGQQGAETRHEQEAEAVHADHDNLKSEFHARRGIFTP